MPVNYQIVPQHVYPHQHVQINDNTEIQATYASGSSDVTAMMCVFASPKGRDNKIQTIRTGLRGFMKEYGLGAFSVYGQPLLNAYAAASTNQCLVHCLRVTADDATYASAMLMANIKTEEEATDLGSSTSPDGSLGEGEVAIGETVTKIRLFTRTLTEPLSNLGDMADLVDVPETIEDDGSVTVPLFILGYVGRGDYGNSLRWRLTTDKTTDKNNKYKNYILSMYTTDTGMQEVEQHHICFVEDAVYVGSSIYAPDVINDESGNGSKLINLYVNQAGFVKLWETYKADNPDTHLTFESFDPLLGIDKTTRGKIPNLEISGDVPSASTSEVNVVLNATTGIPLTGGNEGSLTVGNANRETTLRNLYVKAFSGDIDPYIRSKNRFPTTFIYDANYPIEVKQLIASLALVRTDCMCSVDCGTGIITKASVRAYVDQYLASYINDRVQTIEPYCMKVRDPYSQKSVTVTSTYWLSLRYPQHIYAYGGKHRPLSGNRFGVITGYTPNSVYPIFDEDLDSEEMDELAEMHINFAKYNANQEICRAMQDTRQVKQTVLSEQNNMLIVLDIKRDAERLSAQFEYDFSEPEDLARFNAAMQVLVDKYAAAQVRSITAAYSKNQWESERNYIHLNIALVCKDLVRTTIIEIDVNRSSV